MSSSRTYGTYPHEILFIVGKCTELYIVGKCTELEILHGKWQPRPQKANTGCSPSFILFFLHIWGSLDLNIQVTSIREAG